LNLLHGYGTFLAARCAVLAYACPWAVAWRAGELAACRQAKLAVVVPAAGALAGPAAVAQGESVIKYKSSLNVLTDTYDYSYY
jgi:hypothetical protein